MRKTHITTLALFIFSIVAWFAEPSGRLICICVAFAISFGMVSYTIPNILTVSYRKKLYDEPDGRRIHKTPIPRLGGLAFLPTICCSSILASSLYATLEPSYIFHSLRGVMLLCPLIIVYMAGVIDDLIGMRSLTKLFVQIAAGGLVVWSGLWIDNLGGLFGIHSLPAWVGMPLTVMFVVLVINAMNLIDGADGLAAGLSIISLLIYGIHSYSTGSLLLSMIAAACVGSLLPFFYANVRGIGPRRHKLFMGDTGSQSIGLIMSIFAIALIMRGGNSPVKQNMVLALSPLVVPVFDLIHVALFRMANGKHPFTPDMTHVHHRLMQRGFSVRLAVTMILCGSVFFTLINSLLAPYLNITLILAIDVVVWSLLGSNFLGSTVGRRRRFMFRRN